MTRPGSITTRKPWRDVLTELVGEFRRWGIDDYVLPTLREAQQANAVTVQYAVRGKWTTVRCEVSRHQPAHNLFAIKECVKAARLADQRGIGDVLTQAAAPLALTSADDPYHVLGGHEGIGEDELRRLWRQKAQETHPDHGGSAEAFQRAKAAAEKLGVA